MATLSLSAMGAAQAQEQDSAGLEVIFVTAQKRVQGLQDTPIAISAISAAALEARGVQNISGLQDFTPNLVFDSTAPISGVSSGAVIFIRGVGQTDFSLTTDPGVGTYVDGVYMSRSVGGVLDVLDLERIEVLRGPQGTLFGRNTIGGAISLVSRRPAEEFGVRGEIAYGNRDRIDLFAALDAPINDAIRTKVVGSFRQQDGFMIGLADDRDQGNTDRWSLRGTVEVDFADNFMATISADYTKIDEQNAASKLVGISIQPPIALDDEGVPVSLTTTRTDIRFDRDTGGVVFENFEVPAGAPSLAFLQNAVDVPALGDLPFDERWITPDLDTTFATGPNGTELDIWGVSLTLDWDLGWGEVKSITAYRKTDGRFARDADGSPVDFATTNNFDYGQDQFSQELQLTGRAFDDRLQYAAGVYYFDESGNDELIVTLPDAFGFVSNFTFVNNQSIAAYAQATYEIIDNLSLTAGARYTEDDKEYTAPAGGNGVTNGLAAIFGPTGTQTAFFPPGTVSETFDDWSFKAILDYNFGNGTLAYISYSEGFKSGGFNVRYLVPVPNAIPFTPERLTTYEAGLKWQGLDNRLRVNAAVFHSDYEDVQLVIYNGGAPIITNAGDADITGFELELQAVPTENLSLGFGLGYLDAEYTAVAPLDPLIAPDVQVGINNRLPNTPEWTMNAFVQYAQPVSTLGEIIGRVDWNYSSSIQNDAVNSRFLFQPSYHLVNAQLTYQHDDGRWSISAFAENVFNERVLESGDSNFGIGFHEATFNEPREYGVRVRFNY
ncbi:MAG: TonB-dependent receptor [Pseudomonadota bacterium]